MNWFAWRQHRKSFVIFGILLALYAVIVIPTGLHFWHVYQHAVADCAQGTDQTCTFLSTSALFPTTADRILTGLIPTTVIFLPIILGVFLGAPLLAKEYTEGTNSLVWTQSVSRRKWLTVKLVWILGATFLLMAAFAGLITWWSKTSNALDMDRFSNGNEFGIQGIVPIAIGLFAVSWGVLFGVWFRKVIVAMGLTLALLIVVAHIVIPNLARPNYMTPLSVTAPFGPDNLNASGGRAFGNDWITSQTIYDGNGHAVLGDIFPAAPAQCQKVMQQAQVPGNQNAFKAIPSPGGGDPINECLDKAGWTQVTKYQPSYRYWDFQWIESGIYLGLTTIAVAGTYWFVLKRDA